jgi:hypothetical protein
VEGAGTRNWRAVASFALMCFLFTPVTILIHELGHLSVALAVGIPAQLHPTSVSGGADQASGLARGLIALQAGAGPLFTVVMVLVAAYLYRRRPSRTWAIAFALTAGSRFAVDTAYLGVRLLLALLGRTYAGHPSFDEHNVARTLSLPPEALAASASLFLGGLVLWCGKCLPPKERVPQLLVAAFAIVLGNIVWAQVAPPVLISSSGR